MDISTKLAYAKTHIDNIAKHDDEPEEDVRAALVELSTEVEKAIATLTDDRLARAKEAE